MAGETIKTKAVCLAIHPWSQTSHVVRWLTESGVVATVVKGAVRPKSAFLGQYDLNYTCEILYYARAHGDVHALRECSPLDRRDRLRGDFRAILLSDWFRHLTGEMAPNGSEAAAWFQLLVQSLDELPSKNNVRNLLVFELEVLRLNGLFPEFTGENGIFYLKGERRIPVCEETIACLRNPADERNSKILLDAVRVISVFYYIHVDFASDVRRLVLQMISQPEEGEKEQ